MRTTTNQQSRDKSTVRDAAAQIEGKGEIPKRKTRETKAERQLRRGSISVERFLKLMA